MKIGQIKSNKYGNKKVTIDGYKFDSTLEGKRYTQLKMMLRSGKIDHLVLQPEYVLQEAFAHEGKKYKAIKYVSDFRYMNQEGAICVEDVKGKLTKEYQIKKKMFLLRYGDEVKFKELYAKDIL